MELRVDVLIGTGLVWSYEVDMFRGTGLIWS